MKLLCTMSFESCDVLKSSPSRGTVTVRKWEVCEAFQIEHAHTSHFLLEIFLVLVVLLKSADAPPMIEEPEQQTDALTWWHGLTDAERDLWSDRVGRMADLGLGLQPRPERVIAEDALALRLQAEPAEPSK